MDAILARLGPLETGLVSLGNLIRTIAAIPFVGALIPPQILVGVNEVLALIAVLQGNLPAEHPAKKLPRPEPVPAKPALAA